MRVSESIDYEEKQTDRKLQHKHCLTFLLVWLIPATETDICPAYFEHDSVTSQLTSLAVTPGILNPRKHRVTPKAAKEIQ